MNNDILHKSIRQLIDSGLGLMRDSQNLTEELYQIWINYANKIVEMSTKDNPALYLHFLRLQLNLEQKQIQPLQKISTCLEYLIEMLKMV